MAKADVAFYFFLAFIAANLISASLEKIYLPLITVVIGGGLFYAFSERRGSHILWILCGILAGMCYYRIFLFVQEARFTLPFEETIAITGIASDAPKPYGDRVSVRIAARAPQHGEFLAILESAPPLAYGDEVAVRGALRKPEKQHEDPFMLNPQIARTGARKGIFIKRALADMKRAFVSSVNRALPARSAALVAGLTVGERRGFDRVLREEMRGSGTTHLVALSGYNIMIIVGAIEHMLRGRLRRRAVFIVTISLIALFVTMVGGEASIVRAAIMGGMLLALREAGRMRAIHRAIALSAWVMLIFDPRLARWDVGFQLSFASLLGIVYLLPALLNSLKRALPLWKSTGMREHLMTSAAAQFAVLPLIVATFGQSSLGGILANALLLPFVPLVMALGALIGIVGMSIPGIAAVIAWIAHPLLAYMLGVIHVFSRITIPVSNPIGGIGAFVVYYAMMIAFIRKNS